MIRTECLAVMLAFFVAAGRIAEHPRANEPADDARPNIVVFLVDDMGWQDTSVPFHTELTPKCLLTKRLVNRFPCLEPRQDRRPGKRPAPRHPRTMELQI